MTASKPAGLAPRRASQTAKLRAPVRAPISTQFRIISLNLNGIRSAARKGVFEWLATQHADVICVQELKAQEADMAAHFLANATHTGWFHYAEKKGYSGAGLYARIPPATTHIGYRSQEFDSEGRYVRADFDREIDDGLDRMSVISLYMPSGSSSPERQEAKFRFLGEFLPHLAALKKESEATGREFVICGDWNIAHREIDLKNWRSNQKNSGFLPEERAWLTRVFDELGWVDVYRVLHPEATGESYTWWSNRGQAWANNVGWRIDYQIATPGLASKATQASIWKQTRFSDHAPLIIDYAIAG
ncbi:MAG: exodeoxyribonuclease III [Burkholderiaceae bacterium]